MKKLYRSQNDKKIFGVCGGIAEYFDGYWHNDFKMPKKAMKEIIAIIQKYEGIKDADSN